jgi:hypothetical protein
MAPADAIAALRERGAHLRHPVRFRYLEALALRAAGHEGEARRWLDARLTQALAQCSLPAASTPLPPEAVPAPRRASGGPLADLVREINGRAAPAAWPKAATGRPAPEAQPAEPQAQEALDYFRSTWARLAVAQQLSRSLAEPPDNAGPLNSHLLVLRALRQMQAISPTYLNRYIAYVDALLWLDQAGSAMALAPASASAQRKRAWRKPGP